MTLFRTAALCGLLGLSAPSALATQTYHPPTYEVEQPAAVELNEQYEALEDEYGTALHAWYDELDAVQKKNEAGAQEGYPPSPDGTFYPRFWALSEKGQLDARLYCLGNFGFTELPRERRLVAKLRLYLATIDAGHATHGAEIVRALSAEASPWGDGLGQELAFALLDELAVVSGASDVQARVLYTKGSTLDWSDEEGAGDLASMQYELLVERFPDHELAVRARGKLFAADNLQIGMQVPDIVGKDVEGNVIKLSDYAGKVAVIDFWGFW